MFQYFCHWGSGYSVTLDAAKIKTALISTAKTACLLNFEINFCLLYSLINQLNEFNKKNQQINEFYWNYEEKYENNKTLIFNFFTWQFETECFWSSVW
jgi:hypothetical protein